MLDYTSLFAMATVIREGSFERAARALNVTPSAVSQRVRLLEERAGCALIIREQPCRPTAMGQRLCQHLDRVRLLEQELDDTMPGLAPKELVRVTIPVAVNADSFATWFVPALASFTSKLPVLMDVSVDDEDYTAGWLRSGKVLAAVSGSPRPGAGCNSLPLGSMRYLAVASPNFMKEYFEEGVGAQSLSRAPSMVFNSKDQLQARWVQRLCHRHVEIPKHILPSPEAFVTATELGMGWGLHPASLIANQLNAGTLVELLPESPLDVPLHWHYARSASTLVEELTRHLMAEARKSLVRT